jgi:hypothetical protein
MNTPGESENKKWIWNILILLIPPILGFVCAYLAAISFTNCEEHLLAALWFSGAVALGFISGYTTGASKYVAISSEFLKFLSGGVLVPLFGGAAGLIQGPEKVIESYRYVDDQLIKKVVETSGPLHAMHPLAVLGGFLVFYGFFAVVGILVGVYHRTKRDISISIMTQSQT